MDAPDIRRLEEQAEELSQAELLDLASRLIEIARAKAAERGEPIDWREYAGVLKHGPDPLDYQHQIRSEWDGRS